jgi:hypothetical protein
LDSGSCQLTVYDTACSNCIQSGLGVVGFDPSISSTFVKSNPLISSHLCYGAGTSCVDGYVGTDTVTWADYKLPKFSMSVDTNKTSPSIRSGIMGLCQNMSYYSTSQKSPANSSVNMLVKAAGLTHNMFSFEFLTTTSGRMTFGGYDTDTFPNPIWLPITKKGFYWQVSWNKIQGYNLPANTLMIVDSGSPPMQIPTSFNTPEFLKTFGTGCSIVSGEIQCACSSINDMSPIVYTFSGHDFTIPPTAYATYHKSTKTCSTVIQFDDSSLKIGPAFMKAYLPIFDYDNERIGFAEYDDPLF